MTDGSLSSCPPAEAVTWGKVDKDTYQQTTESMQADYSMVMPFLVKALLDNRGGTRRWRGGGRGGCFAREPQGAGVLAGSRGIPAVRVARGADGAVDRGCEGERGVAVGESGVPAGEVGLSSPERVHALRLTSTPWGP